MAPIGLNPLVASVEETMGNMMRLHYVMETYAKDADTFDDQTRKMTREFIDNWLHQLEQEFQSLNVRVKDAFTRATGDVQFMRAHRQSIEKIVSIMEQCADRMEKNLKWREEQQDQQTASEA
jgi:hypothetical protein